MFTEKFFQELLTNQPLRIEACASSFELFIHVYMSRQIKYRIAPFQKEIIDTLQNGTEQTVLITGFRGSGKSTIVTTMFSIWSMAYKESRMIIILSKTQAQAEQHLRNIKSELESNDTLKKDLGPFVEFSDEWHRQGIHVKKYDCKIVAASIEQSIRGMKHKTFRPDLIIADDIEDSDSVLTLESRNKIDRFLREEVLFVGDTSTRFIMVGNKLHQDAVMMRLKGNIEADKMDGKYMEFPIVDSNGNPAWPGKFPTKESIEKEKRRIGDEVAWEREAMLNPIDPKKQIIKLADIHYWDEMPKNITTEGAVGVDLASELHEKADYTTMVGGLAIGYGENCKIYVQMPMIREKLEFDEQIEAAYEMSKAFTTNYKPTFYVEKVGYQGVFCQKLKKTGVHVEPVVPLKDKAVRLHLVAPHIRNGDVLFPREGSEELISELVNFGSTKHDDLMDALVLLVTKLKEKKQMGVASSTYYPKEDSYWTRGMTSFDGFAVWPTKEQQIAFYARTQSYLDEGWL